MRRIIFNDETINAIRDYINQGHSKKETCNRFTIKRDTLNRVMRENNIEPYFKNKINSVARKKPTEDTINLVCNLFANTYTRLQDICNQANIEYWELQEILNNNFTQEYIDKRKSKLYSNSKLGKRNPMFGKYGEQHPKYIGMIDDGKGYLMCLKPDWYTSRKNSKYVFVHSLVMCEALGITEIPKGFVVHHIDGDKKNNDISNLCLLQMGAHTKLHQLQNNLCKVQRLSNNGVGNKIRNAEQ